MITNDLLYCEAIGWLKENKVGIEIIAVLVSKGANPSNSQNR